MTKTQHSIYKESRTGLVKVIYLIVTAFKGNCCFYTILTKDNGKNKFSKAVAYYITITHSFQVMKKTGGKG